MPDDPFFCPSSILVGANNRAVHKVDFPLDMTLFIGFDLQALEELLPHAFFAPFVKAAVDRLPGTISIRQVAPWCTCFQNPENAVNNLAMTFSWPSCFRLLRWQERLELFPLLIR